MRRLLVRTGLGVGACLLVLGAEVVYVVSREYLPASSAPPVAGSYGPADGVPTRLVVIGDSTAFGVGATSGAETVAGALGAALARAGGRRVEVTGHAVSGARAADIAQQARLVPADADLVVLLVGANDATHGTPLASVRRSVRAALDALPDGVPVVVGTCPDLGAVTAFPVPLRQIAARRGQRVADATATAARDRGAAVVDLGAETGPAFRADPDRYLSSDEFHPSGEGYRLWAEALLPAAGAALAR